MVVPENVSTVTGCPVAASVTVKLVVMMLVTGPVTLLMSTRLPPEPGMVLTPAAIIGVIVKVVVLPAGVPTKESATLNSIETLVGWPAEKVAALGKVRLTKLDVKVGESSQILGVAAAVHEFGGVAVSASVKFGSTLTDAVAVPNVTRMPV